MFSLSLLKTQPFRPSDRTTSDHAGRVVSVRVTLVPPCRVNMAVPVVSGVLRSGVVVIMIAPERSVNLRCCVKAKMFDSTRPVADNIIITKDPFRNNLLPDRRRKYAQHTTASRQSTDTIAQPSVDRIFTNELNEYINSKSVAE